LFSFVLLLFLVVSCCFLFFASPLPSKKENKKTKQKTPFTPLLKHFLVLFFFFLADRGEGRQHKTKGKQTPLRRKENKKTLLDQSLGGQEGRISQTIIKKEKNLI